MDSWGEEEKRILANMTDVELCATFAFMAERAVVLQEEIEKRGLTPTLIFEVKIGKN